VPDALEAPLTRTVVTFPLGLLTAASPGTEKRRPRLLKSAFQTVDQVIPTLAPSAKLQVGGSLRQAQ
jgi:hypothetical protein